MVRVSVHGQGVRPWLGRQSVVGVSTVDGASADLSS